VSQPTRRVRRAVLFKVGRFFGVPLYFAPSWFLIAALITVMYAAFIRTNVDNVSNAGSYAAGAGFALALALCVLAHELGHVAVSLALGKRVRRVVILFLGGVSEIEDEISRPRDEFLIAVAGPLASGVLGGGLFAAAEIAPPSSLSRTLLVLLAWSNIVLAAFNLLPGLPLDGGRVLRAAIWGATHSPGTGIRYAAWSGRGVAVLVFAGSTAAAARFDDIATALFGALLAAFIWSGATRSLQVAAVTERLGTVQLAHLLRPGILVDADVSLAEALRRAREVGARGIVVVDRSDVPRAIVDESRVRQIQPERQPWTPVSDVARTLEPGLVLAESLDSDGLIAAIRATPANEYLVVRGDGSLAGIFSSSDLTTILTAGVR
jgi:Zn-dependent protease/CBS domain-containing protein